MMFFQKLLAATLGHIPLQDSPKLAYLPVYDDVISKNPVIFPYSVRQSIQSLHGLSTHSVGIQASSIFKTDKNDVFVCACHLY
jgi:hypothetical protein